MRLSVTVIMSVVVRMVMLVVSESLRAMEGHEDQPEAIESGYEYAKEDAPVGIRCTGNGRFVDSLDERILGKEPRSPRKSDQRQRADDTGEIGNRHVFPQAAHLAHVLL